MSGSPAINAGINVGLPYNGSAPDIGYLESLTINVYYISISGIDAANRNGSIGQEWATLAYATTRVTASGSIIHVNSGTFVETVQMYLAVGVSIEGNGSALSIIHSHVTSAGAFLLMLHSAIGSENTNGNQHISNVTFDGGGATAIGGVSIFNRGNVVIHDCIFKDFYQTGIQFNNHDGSEVTHTWAVGNQFYSNTVQNCSYASGTYGSGGLRIGGQQGMLVHHNTLTQLGRASGTNGYVIKYGAEGWNKGLEIYNNTITKSATDGTYFPFAVELTHESGLLFHDNIVECALDVNFISKGTYSYGLWAHHNTFSQAALSTKLTEAFILEFNVEDVIIEKNYINNVGVPVSFTTRSGYNLSNFNFTYNICRNIGVVGDTGGRAVRILTEDSKAGSSSNGFYIYNNVFQATTTVGAIPAWGINIPTLEDGNSNNIIRNNVITGFSNGGITANNATEITSLIITNNVLYGNGNNNEPYYVGTPSGYTYVVPIKLDPKFVSISDFHLQSDSPCRGAGIYVGLVSDYEGSAAANPPSIGAYEYPIPPTYPTVTTTAVTSITSTTAASGGNVTSTGGATVTARGVCWSTSINPTVALSTKTSDGTGLGSFTSTLTGLTSSTFYYVRAYATNSIGTAYGDNVTFTTATVGVQPTVTTTAITGITTISATGGGNVTSIGSAPVTARGVCWSTSTLPVATGSHTTDGTGLGVFTSTLTGLTPSTYYYVRAYATNSVGTSYGVQTSFTTSAIVLATVTTTAITFINPTTATGGGNVTSDGGGTVSSRGICWSTSTTPTTANSHTTETGGTGVFTSTLTGLTASTFYYVRAYAINQAGTAYGTQVTFTTTALITLPVVTTTVITNNDTPTATGGGNVTSTGGGTVTARGICWSTSADPTIALSTKTSDGSGLGVFVSTLTGLTNGVFYYVRAYATNSVGTAYGNNVTFTSVDIAALISISAANLCNFYILEYEIPGYVILTAGGITIRKGVRDGRFVVDIVLTPTGFSGVEDIDWENIKTVE